ncbi:hypothetical protein H4219_000233 [Mycoemilia scoparia]|uniref:Riboflavin kinase n=1 Tax=Mycoemilia scoparia TaxID=417184 RepID=A0A9W8AB02_9FUNG|nr:hypothetical protein H4219_000233 [Mycoemilia scoparia]
MAPNLVPQLTAAPVKTQMAPNLVPQLTAAPVKTEFPIFISGEVVRGFGRGGKDLNVPTANLPEETVNKALATIPIGIYYGWAQLETEKKEVHIIHNYEYDFYGRELKVCIAGYIRPELNFESLDQLIAAIKNDISIAENALEKEPLLSLKEHSYFV